MISMRLSSIERPLLWYMSGQAAWYLGAGVNMVLYPWLVAIELTESAEWVGIAQMATMAPSILLMLPGGALADRIDLRKQLFWFQILAALPSLLLILIIASGSLRTGLVILVAALLGSVLAFVTPARDSLLNRVSKGPIQTAVTLAILVQFAAMLMGILVAGTASLIGAIPILLFHMACVLSGAFFAWRQQPAPPLANPPGAAALGKRAGLALAAKAVFGSTVIRPPMLGVIAVGLFYVGAFLVVLPLLARDVYHGGAFEIAAVNVAFWVGTILATTILLKVGVIRRQGRVYLLATSGGVVILALIGIEGPFWWLCLLCFFWGMGAGVNMTMGRTIVQENAPARFRAQVMAIYNLGFMGGAPAGALAMGFLVKFLGPHDAVFVPAAAMIAVIGYLAFATDLWTYVRQDSPPIEVT